MKTTILTTFIFLLLTGCANNDESYKYKVLIYGYSFGERNDTSSYISEEGEYNSIGKIISERKADQLTKYAYDEKGNLISKTRYQYEDDWKDEYTEGQIIKKENFEYDELNRIIKRLVFSEKGELIVVNNLSFVGDTIVIEDGFGTDLSDELIYQSVRSMKDNPSVKSYSKKPYWKLTYLKENQVNRIVLSESQGGSFFDQGIIDYQYDIQGRLLKKNVRSGFTKPPEIISTDMSNFKWADFKVIESKPELKTPNLEESFILLTKPCDGKILQSEYFEYNEYDSLKLYIKDLGEVKIQTQYFYPDKFTEIREYSGSPYDSGNGKTIHIFDKFLRPKSIEDFNVMGEPQEFKEYIYD